MEWNRASDIQKRIKNLIASLSLAHLDHRRIFCFRSFGSTSRARARIWSLPRIWQIALGVGPAYCIEILGEKFDRLSKPEQEKILLHELLHIPKNFSGSLLPHYRKRGGGFEKKVELLFRKITKV